LKSFNANLENADVVCCPSVTQSNKPLSTNAALVIIVEYYWTIANELLHTVTVSQTAIVVCSIRNVIV